MIRPLHCLDNINEQSIYLVSALFFLRPVIIALFSSDRKNCPRNVPCILFKEDDYSRSSSIRTCCCFSLSEKSNEVGMRLAVNTPVNLSVVFRTKTWSVATKITQHLGEEMIQQLDYYFSSKCWFVGRIWRHR